MTDLGGSRSLSDRYTYVQSSPPQKEQPGVRWVDSDTDTVYIYSADYSDWLKESRVWAQTTQPNPRVGPLDGDRWIDTSQTNRPTYVYSTDTGGWESSTPSSTKINGATWGVWNAVESTSTHHVDKVSEGTTNTHTIVWDHADFKEGRTDQFDWRGRMNGDTTNTGTDGLDFTLEAVRVYVDGNTEVSDTSSITGSNGNTIEKTGSVSLGSAGEKVTLEMDWHLDNHSLSTTEFETNVYVNAYQPRVWEHDHSL